MATAATAPVTPAVYFSSRASVFGIGPAVSGAATLITGASGGGLGVLTAEGGQFLTAASDTGVLSFTNDPTLVGNLTVAVSDGGGTITAEGLITAEAGLHASGGKLTMGGTLAIDGITVNDGVIVLDSGTGDITLDGDIALDGGITLGGDLSVAGGNIVLTNLGNITLVGTVSSSVAPTEGNHLTNKTYVDSVASGLLVRKAVRLATTENLSAGYSGGVLTANTPSEVLEIDGVEVTTIGDRVLVKDQSTGSKLQNGIYTLTRAAGDGIAWQLTRAIDANTSALVLPGLFTFVTGGNANEDTGFVLSTDGPITLGEDDLEFSQFSAAAATSAVGSEGFVQYCGSSNAFAGDAKFTFSPSGRSSAGLLTVNNITSGTGRQLGLSSDTGASVLVGALSNTGAVAFGESADANAARAIALGANAVARVPDTLRITAIPIVAKSQSPGAVGAAATFASALTALTSVAFSVASTGNKSQIDIPAGSRFIPHSIMAWCETWTSNDDGRTVSINLNTANDGSGTVVGGSSIDFIPSGVTAARSSSLPNNTAIAAGAYFVYVSSIDAEEVEGADPVANVRFTIFGLLIETA